MLLSGGTGGQQVISSESPLARWDRSLPVNNIVGTSPGIVDETVTMQEEKDSLVVFLSPKAEH